MRRDFRPGCEGVESRELLSSVPLILAMRAPSLHIAPGARSFTGSAVGPALTGTGGNTIPLLGQGTPTPHELARERFAASFRGPYTVGAGRFSDQKQILFARGLGTSTSFLHGNYDIGIVTPVDPNAPLSGLAVLNDKNLNSGNILGLDLTGDQASLDRFGRPTHLTFTSDPNVYGGNFFVTASSGTVDITYVGKNAYVKFQGLVYTSGLTSPLRNADLISNRGRGF